MRPSRRTLIIVTPLLLSLTSCSLFDSSEDDMPAKTIDRVAQTDAEPVLRRTAGLPEDAAYLWYSGTLAGTAPGPSTYWVDAQVTPNTSDMDRFRATCADAQDGPPAVVPELADRLSAADFAECPALATEIATEGWKTRAWISRTEPVIVISLLGQG